MATSSQHELVLTPTGIPAFGAIAITHELGAELMAMGEDVSKFNTITWRGGGCTRWSEAVILCPFTEVQGVLASSSACSSPWAINIGNINGPSRESFFAQQMYLIEVRPVYLRFNQGGIKTNGLYALHFADQRYFLRGVSIVEGTGFNITTTTDRTKYYDQSEKSGPTPWTWAQIILYLLQNMGISATNNLDYSGAGTPIDYQISGESTADILDRVLCCLGACLVAMPDGTFIIDSLSKFNQAQDLQEDALIGERTAGGMLYANAPFANILNSVMPSQVTVKFPRQLSTYIDAQSASHPPVMNQIFTQTSTSGKPSGASGRPDYEAIVYDSLWAIGDVGSETNTSAIQARADFIAGVYYQRWKSFGTNTRFRGIFDHEKPFTGTMVYHHTVDGTFTDMHNDFYLFPVGGDMDAMGDMAVRRITTLGGLQSWRSFDGTVFLSTNKNNEEDIGMYPGMVHQVVAANTGGWDWLHAHSALS